MFQGAPQLRVPPPNVKWDEDKKGVQGTGISCKDKDGQGEGKCGAEQGEEGA